MALDHGVIVNLSNNLPFVFDINPVGIDSKKSINYFEAPNIGGSHHQKFFTGFGNAQITFNVISIDKDDPTGVMSTIAFFEALREPAPGLLGIAGSFFGNENFPPPKVLYNFGTGSIMPQIWVVDSVVIKTSLLKSGTIEGLYGIPKKADFTITLSLDEDNVLNRANQIAKKSAQVGASVKSLLRSI